MQKYNEKDEKIMYATIWSLVPPLIAIILALITKEVYSSLFIGIVTAALFCTKFNVVAAYTTIFNDGFISSLSDSSHVGILVFLVILGTIVVLMNKAGGSAAYGKWAQQKIKTRKGTLLATFALGVLVFVDDYFNCLTVGSVMRPVTDKHNVSRAKLAYLIDATAAPICMIAPISSWAAAVAGVVKGTDGLTLFIQAIPYNLYSLLTIAGILLIVFFDIDFGLMKKHEDNAKNGDIFTSGKKISDNEAFQAVTDKGKVIDLAFPVITLIICCIIGMIYTGGFFDGENFINAFANCNSSLGLAMGSTAALLITIAFYVFRKVLSFKDCMDSFPEGFKAMISPILILTFAWTLSNLTGQLGAAEYVSGIFAGNAQRLTGMLPAIVFLVAIFLAFSTGTSWGTFGILLPIVVGIKLPGDLLIITIAACLAGAVCGDHCSPISDTTIMASAGAQCDHINHVSTQLPYALLVALVSFIGYCIAGFVQNPWIVLVISFILLCAILFGIKKFFVTE
ncbi:MAG: Na+/H+ antiporter NhaC family protein [Lachnospiraceae bacterium]